MIGQIISSYKIISVIGEGGMGIVYLAEHIHLGRKAAIKSLHKKFLSNNNIKERFKNEAATLSQIQHPNIVKLYDYIETSDGLYLIMEYVDGVLLDQYIKNESGPIKESNSIKIMNGLLEGFAYAHHKNIVHRDVKPSNIMINRDFSVVKILDFGIAKILNEDSRNLTKDGTQMGTVYYMSPEQVKGLKLDNRSDIYSLGVTFFQMLTGTNPYEKMTSEYEIYNMITQIDLPNVRSVYPYISDKAEYIIQKATRKNPSERYQNCNELIIDLNNSSTPKIQSEQHITPVYKDNLSQSNNNSNLIIALVGTLLLVGIIVVVFLFQNPSPHSTSPKVPDPPDSSWYRAKIDTPIISPYPYNEKFRYIGLRTTIKNGLPNGNGKAIYDNGDIYEGDFVNGIHEGNGKYIWSDGFWYEGSFQNNQRNGKGTYYNPNGTVNQKGFFKNGSLLKSD